MQQIRAISSKHNPLVKSLRTLATDSRELRSGRRTLLDGPHLVEAYRRWRGIPEMLVVSDAGSCNSEVIKLLSAWPDVETIQLSDSLFREVSGLASPVGILAVIAIPAEPTGEIVGSCVVLDAVQDAGNVGAIMRSAAAAGIREVVLGHGCATAWAPRVLRAAQGAHFSIRVRERVDIEALLLNYSGLTLATVARDGASLYDIDLTGNVAWVLGNEGAGVSEKLVSLAHGRVTVPIAADTESLNVAAAAAICLFEQVRQRIPGKGGNSV